MRTPAGKSCQYYYEDYFRGTTKQECRLLDRNPDGGTWKPGHCKSCPVPDILRQNQCPNLALEAKVEKSFFGLREGIKVYAVCTQKLAEVKEPAVGCGECHLNLKDLNVKVGG
jgi:hypothetical protein